MPHSQGIYNIPYPELNQNPITRIDTYLFKIHSNIVLHLGLSKGPFPVALPVKIFKALLPSFWLHAQPISIFYI